MGFIHLTVSAIDVAVKELYKREFDVPMEQNNITWVSGAFYGSGSSPTVIGGITDWAGGHSCQH